VNEDMSIDVVDLRPNEPTRIGIVLWTCALNEYMSGKACGP
jgi:hypothetical protein